MANSTSETTSKNTAVRLNLLVAGGGVFLVLAGLWGDVVTFWAAGAVMILFAMANWPRPGESLKSPIEQPLVEQARPAVRPTPAAGAVDPSDTDGLIEQMLGQERYALLLRPQIAGDLEPAQFDRALETLQKHMALVPDGDVTVGPVDSGFDAMREDEEYADADIHVVRVKRFFLDRHPVTNRQYFEFVAGGGYQQMTLWDESVMPAVLDFVDATGEPGPRHWREGCFLEGTDDHPVVGVCWHEAAAYARWVGKRLPTDAEWIKAGAWPVPTADGGRIQRAYPWGDDMDRERANLWGAGPGHTVSVHEYAGGISLGGVYQLIGNVWEWTANDFTGGDHPLGKLTFAAPMKSVRGGAFDTYFDGQATCQFQSGDGTLSRKRNIGFRLAIGVCDLMLSRPTDNADDEATTSGQPDEATEEVHAGWGGATGDEPGECEPSLGEEARA